MDNLHNCKIFNLKKPSQCIGFVQIYGLCAKSPLLSLAVLLEYVSGLFGVFDVFRYASFFIAMKLVIAPT